jgi:hypothetical protein
MGIGSPAVDDWEVAARLSIEDTLARYSRFADGGRPHDLAALFTDDGVLAVGTRELTGRDEIAAFLGSMKESLASSAGGGRIRHHTSSLRIDFDGVDDARATSYFLAITAAGPDHWGVYRDHLRRVNERWLLSRREAITEGAAAEGWQGGR